MARLLMRIRNSGAPGKSPSTSRERSTSSEKPPASSIPRLTKDAQNAVMIYNYNPNDSREAAARVTEAQGGYFERSDHCRDVEAALRTRPSATGDV